MSVEGGEERNMERGMTIDQVLKALWRRKLLVLAVAGGAFAIGAAVVATLPSVYTATAAVRIEPTHPIADMVQPTVSETVDRRVVTIRQELLSRPVLQRTIEEMGLYPEIVSEHGIDAAVETMRQDLDVVVEGDSAFEITYSAADPTTAANVTNRLLEIFSEEGVKSREAMARRTTELFTAQMDELKKAVTDWEARIAQFKVDHMGELPEQLEVNMRALERASADIQARTDELRLAEIRRSDLLRAHYAGDSEAGRLQGQLMEAQRALVAARSQWTADHPEVQRLSKEQAAIRARLRDAEGRMVAEKQERARMSRYIDELKAQIGSLQKQAEAYQARLDNTPRWANELALMNRDYEAVRAKYESVMSRKVEAELAQDLEAKSAKSLFNVISPAVVPAAPAKPDRMGGLVISFLIALALGVLVGVLAEMRDESFRDVNEVKQRLPMPVLAVVPEMGAAKGEKRVLLPQYPQRPSVPETIN